jgi:1-acyl-sn-glycerol-3-phosphate acyltransferase
MQFLRSLLFTLIFYSVTLLFVLIGLAALPFGRGAVRGVADIWTRFYGYCTRLLLDIRTRVEGTVPTGPVIVAGKHQSMYETLELVVLLDTPAIVMKRELSEIPLFGRLTRRYGIIPVDRSAGAAALRTMLRAADEAKAEGRPIVIFPEGTRVAPGETPPLQPGFAGLYRMLKLPVVPLALDSGRLWPRHGVTKRSGTVTFRFGDPIPPGLPREEIEARVHAAINALN